MGSRGKTNTFQGGLQKTDCRGCRKRVVIAWMNQDLLEGYAFEGYLDVDWHLWTSHIILQSASSDHIQDLGLDYHI